jgi:hypothetical protein
MKDNLHYFKFSQYNPEDFLDKNYMFVEEDSTLPFYRDKTQKIKELLTTIKNIENKNNSKKVLDIIFTELQDTIKKHANYSEFGCFINACDSTMEENINDIGLLKTITFLYLKKRKLTDIVPLEWIQALIDKGSSRKKGHAGENKLITILENNSYVKAKDINDFNKKGKSFAKLSRRGRFSNGNIKNFFKVSIGKETQGKSLDIIVKNKGEIFFVEAKHLNTGGGGQNKQVLELIEIIRKNSGKENHHFVAFLDGIHSNNILNFKMELKDKNEENKIKVQHEDILKALKKNKNNYWVNTAGFKELFKD